MGFDDQDREQLKTLTAIKIKIEHLEKMMESFVTRPEFDPVKKLVYGVAALMLSALVAAVVSQVLKP